MAILALPNEILHIIFGYLTLSDLASLARSCSWLYHAVSDYPQPEGATVTLRGDNISCALRVLATCRQHVARLSFVGCDLQQESRGVWERFWDWLGPGLLYLTFRNCEIGERPFLQVLGKCEQLISIEIDDCNSLLMSGKLFETAAASQDGIQSSFKSLTSPPSSAQSGCRNTLRRLSIRNTRYLSDAMFNRITRHFVHLEHLSLAGCQISFHSAIYKRFYPSNRPDQAAVGSESILTFQNVLEYVSRRGAALLSLDLSGTQVDDRSLVALSRLPTLQLQTLLLAGCQQITRDGVAVLCRHTPSLCRLDLSGTRVSDATLVSLTDTGSPQRVTLRTLNLANCLMLTDESLPELGCLGGLRSLDLSGCTNVTAWGLGRALNAPPISLLTSLSLAGCKVSEDVVVGVATRLTHLRELDLSECAGGVTNTAVQTMAANLHLLRTLRLAWCGAVGYAGLTGQLKVESTTASKNGYTDSGVCGGGGTGVPISRMAGLRELSLRGCSEVTDASLLEAVHFMELTSLDLSACVRITDIGVCALGHRNPSLETLHLSKCYNVTDEGVAEMVSWLPRLRHLYLQGCRKIGSGTVSAIERRCPQLRDLGVSVPTPTMGPKDLMRMESKFKCLHININHQLDTSKLK